jgi:acyl-CoA thioesterase
MPARVGPRTGSAALRYPHEVVERDLDRALGIEQSGTGAWRAVADPNYESLNGMFGGWTAALALRAVMDSAPQETKPSVLNVNFISKIDPGVSVIVKTRHTGGSRAIGHWMAELMSEDEGTTFAIASVVLASRRSSDGHVDVAAPRAPDPDSLELVFPAPGTAGERCAMRPIEGFPPYDRSTTYSTAWVKETSGRPVDHLQLAFLSDFRPPRSFFWSGGPRPSATLALCVYFHATDEEVADLGDDYLLSEAFGIRGEQSTSEEHLRLWSPAGALLSSSFQMAWYR